jgi:hypothetical protein
MKARPAGQAWRLGLIRERLIERQRLYAGFLAQADRNQLAVVAKGEKSIDGPDRC